MARFSVSVWEPGHGSKLWTATSYDWWRDGRVLWFRTTEGLEVCIQIRSGQIVVEEIAVSRAKSLLYRLLRMMNDVTAIQKGKAPRRILRRTAGKAASKAMRKLLR